MRQATALATFADHVAADAGTVTNLYDPSPFRSSDHDPLLVGLHLAPSAPAWDPGTRYGRGDRVVHDGVLFEATRPHRAKEPGAKPHGPWREVA